MERIFAYFVLPRVLESKRTGRHKAPASSLRLTLRGNVRRYSQTPMARYADTPYNDNLVLGLN